MEEIIKSFYTTKLKMLNFICYEVIDIIENNSSNMIKIEYLLDLLLNYLYIPENNDLCLKLIDYYESNFINFKDYRSLFNAICLKENKLIR